MASITSLKLNDTSFTLGSDGENVEVVDTQGVVGTALEKTNLQSVIDYLCNKVKNELVTDNELTEKLTESLSSYLLKSAIVQSEGTSTDTVPSSNLLKTLLDTVRSDVSELNSGWADANTRKISDANEAIENLHLYLLTGTTNAPPINCWYIIEPIVASPQTILQEAIPINTDNCYFRRKKINNVWGQWYRFNPV